MKQVKIKGLVITHEFGTLNDGDIVRVSESFAKHLVEDCNAGEYVTVEKASTEEPKKTVKAKGK
jgi:hypothetical protein